MIRFGYLAAIVLGSLAMAMIDRRFRLYLWNAPRRAVIVQVIGVCAFLAWDLVCIQLGIFERGQGPFLTGVEIVPHLTIEEPFFLWFLCHFTMIVFTGSVRLFEGQRPHRRLRQGS